MQREKTYMDVDRVSTLYPAQSSSVYPSSRDILEDRKLFSVSQVVTSGIHAEVLEVLAGCQTWEEFELWLL